jgi:elongation factor G
MLFLEEKPITVEELKAGLRRAVIANKIIPMAGGSAFKNKGVQYLIDAVIDYPPGTTRHSASKRPHRSTSLRTKWRLIPDDNGKFIALGFKLWSDKFGRSRVLPSLLGLRKEG